MKHTLCFTRTLASLKRFPLEGPLVIGDGLVCQFARTLNICYFPELGVRISPCPGNSLGKFFLDRVYPSDHDSQYAHIANKPVGWLEMNPDARNFFRDQVGLFVVGYGNPFLLEGRLTHSFYERNIPPP